MKVEDLYQEIILDHYRAKHHSGLREPYDAEVQHVNPTCGDEVRLRVHLVEDTVADVSYEAMGCSISQASTSVMADLVIGHDVAYDLDLYEEFLAMMQSKGQIEPNEERIRGRRQIPGAREVRLDRLVRLSGRSHPRAQCE
jgi:nitrogen fixation protein NifU and related proteins